MKLTKFDEELKKANTSIGTFRPFVGKLSEVILAEDLFERTSVETLLNKISEGSTFKTAHIAAKEQLIELGITVTNNDFFIFDSPTNFTKPVILPE